MDAKWQGHKMAAAKRMWQNGRLVKKVRDHFGRVAVTFLFFLSVQSGRRAVVYSRIDPSLALEELIDRLRRHTKIVPQGPGLLENSGVGGGGGLA